MKRALLLLAALALALPTAGPAAAGDGGDTGEPDPGEPSEPRGSVVAVCPDPSGNVTIEPDGSCK